MRCRGLHRLANPAFLRGVSFLCFAQCCTVLRSRWRQSGVTSSLYPRNTVVHIQFLSAQIGQALPRVTDRRTSASACCILQSASGQVLMDQPHRHNAFTHGRGAPLDRAAAHVAGCEFSRHPRLNEEQPPRTFLAEIPFEHGAVQRFPHRTKLRSSRSTASSSQPVLASAPKRPTTSHPTEPKRPRIPNYCERRRSVTPMCCGP
jgi:hypothetical protein